MTITVANVPASVRVSRCPPNEGGNGCSAEEVVDVCPLRQFIVLSKNNELPQWASPITNPWFHNGNLDLGILDFDDAL
jgi:hypothetical protein